MRNRTRRLRSFSYTGCFRYHVRLSTFGQEPRFRDPVIVEHGRAQLLQHAGDFGFSIDAYCFMPDHVHVLVTGLRADSKLQDFVGRWKQSTGYWFARRGSERLWQPGYFDRVLRECETSDGVARYILANPVRAGLVRDWREYPYAWCRWMGGLGNGPG